MKTGIVLDIVDGRATIMCNKSNLVEVRAHSGWCKGQIVEIVNHKPLIAIAATFLLIMSLGIFVNILYFTKVSLVSIDINPSIELSLNRFDNVIAVTAYNDEGVAIQQKLDIINKNCNEALDTIINSNEMKPYVNDYMTFTVQSNIQEKNASLLNMLQTDTADTIQKCHKNVITEYINVDEKVVANAHSCGVTAGKYLALLELQELVPASVEEYSSCSISTIKGEIERHCKGQCARDGHRHGAGHNNGKNHHG